MAEGDVVKVGDGGHSVSGARDREDLDIADDAGARRDHDAAADVSARHAPDVADDTHLGEGDNAADVAKDADGAQDLGAAGDGSQRQAPDVAGDTDIVDDDAADAADVAQDGDAAGHRYASAGRDVGGDDGTTHHAEVAEDTAADEDDELPRAAGAALYGFVLIVAVALFLGPVATFILWRVRRDEPFIDHHGRQALDLALTAGVAGLLFVAGRVLVPVHAASGSVLQWLALALVALQAVLLMWGLVAAARGRWTRIPLSLVAFRRRWSESMEAASPPPVPGGRERAQGIEEE